jgi:hypothetical protein
VYTTQFRERNEYWTELLMAMSEGNPVGYKTLMATNLNEFYYLYRAHVARVERINNPTSKRTERRPRPAGPTQQPEGM